MITDKSRYGHDAVLDLNCSDSVQVLRTEPMVLTEQEQKIVQKYLGIALLEKSYIDANGHLMVVLSDGRTLDVGSARGLSGATPYLGENGNWFVEGVDTLQSARGLPGFTPYIGENEHWWIDKTDTGIPARGIPLTEKADNTRFLRNDGTWQKVTPENIGAAKQSDFAAQKSIVTDHTNRIEALEQRTATAPYYTDDSVAYVKEVPENALPFASVDKVGGMTRKCTNLWSGEISAKSEPAVYTFDNGTMTLLRDYGGIQAFVWSKEKYKAGTYNLSFKLSGMGNTSNFRILKAKTPSATNIGVDVRSLYADGVYDISFTLEDDGHIGFGTDVSNVKLTASNILLNSGTTALPYEPYFDGLRSAPVTEGKSVGVNLISYPYANTTKTENGMTFTDNGDGTLTLNGTASYQANFYLCQPCMLKAGTYHISGIPNIVGNGSDAFVIYINDAEYKHIATDIGAGRSFTITKDTKVFIRVITYSDFSANNLVVKPMLNKGSTALPYTPYRSDALPIPAEVQALDGYGWGINDKVYNYFDWEKKQFVKRVGRVDMGTLDWIFGGTDYFSTNLTNYSFPINSPYVAPLLCAKYDTVAQAKRRTGTISGYNQSTSAILVTDSDYTDAATFKAAMSGVMLYYELATPVITDISDLLTDDNLIRVEGGGTVTMVNEYGYDVPSEITYARLTWQ